MYRLLLLALCLALFACGSDEAKKAEPGQKAAQPANQETTTPKPPQPEPPSREQMERADALLAFANAGLETLASGRYALANALHANAQLYLHTFRLAPRPQKTGDGSLAAPSGLFDEEDAKLLLRHRQDMDKALDRLLGHYAELEKYVADTSIQDDGRGGRRLVKQIAGAHAQFIKARQGWLEIVQKRAAEAEATLLAGHPLERQIMDGQRIFAQFREIATILASGADRAMLKAVAQNIARLRADAERPPFPAEPGVERLYRAFLHEVEGYQDALSLGLREGFHSHQRRGLNMAALACQKAYNTFAKAANSQED